MRLKIWSVEDGSCPVTLVGHKSSMTAMHLLYYLLNYEQWNFVLGVTQTAIVDRGRNVVCKSNN